MVQFQPLVLKGEAMRNLIDEIKNAERRYYVGQLVLLLLFGIALGSAVGWLLWN